MTLSDRKIGKMVAIGGLVCAVSLGFFAFTSGYTDDGDQASASSVGAVTRDVEAEATTAESISGGSRIGGLTEAAVGPAASPLLVPVDTTGGATSPVPVGAAPEVDPFAEMQLQIDNLRREFQIEDVKRFREAYLAVDAGGLDANVAIRGQGDAGGSPANAGQLGSLNQALAALSGGQGPAPTPDIDQIRASGGRDLGAAASAVSGGAPTAQPSQVSQAQSGFGTGAAIQEVGYARNPPFAALSPYELKKGSFIPAILVTEIVSDNPGAVIAQTTVPVFDSVTGRHLLIPRGSKLSGRYSSDVSFGTERIGVVWNHLIFPDGRTLVLEQAPGASANGASGLKDQVDTRFFETFGLAILTSLIGVGVELISPDDNNDVGRLADELRAGVGENVGTAIDGYVRRNIDLAPRITIRTGIRFNIIVERDFIVPPV